MSTSPTILPDVKAVVTELGGPAKFAAIFGVGETAVFNAIARNRLAAYTLPEVTARLKKRRKRAPGSLWTSTRPARRQVPNNPANGEASA